ncbi:MAG: hypothetical protein AAFV29_06610 [Myxococcota bacterium]
MNPLGKEDWLRNVMQEATQEHVRLIKGLPKALYKDLGRSIFDDLEAGKTHGEIAARLTKDFVRRGVEPSLERAKRRARFIAVDQVGKFHGRLDHERQNDLGVTHYIWRTAKDRRVRGRPSKGIGGAYPNANPAHTTREGKRYSWSRRPPGGHPGHDFGCRCYAEPVLGKAHKDQKSAGRAAIEAAIQRRETARRQREAAELAEAQARLERQLNREEEERRRREQEMTDQILGRTPATKMPQKALRSMTDREVSAEVRRLVALNYISTSANSRVRPKQQFFRIVMQEDVPEDQRVDDSTVASIISGFIAGNTQGAINRAPRVFKALTNMKLQEGPTDIYRGLTGVPGSTIDEMDVGKTFDLGAASSWSKNKDQAKSFSGSGRDAVVISMLGTTRGGDISRISQLDMEEEILKSGTARIVSKTWNADENHWNVVVEDIDD